MSETIIGLIGTGQQVLKNLNDRNYNKVIYFDKNTDNACESPFVCEAIININQNRFKKLVLLGTNSSMWDSLYAYCIDPSEQGNFTEDENAFFGRIAFAIEYSFDKPFENQSDQLLSSKHDLLNEISRVVSIKFGIETICKIIPIADNENELWSVFETINSIDYGKSVISFDITHGLRYHPMFIFLALNYLTAINNNLKFGSYFYGALELSRYQVNHGMAPIIEFKIFGELLQWINAYKNLNRFKDSSELVKLLSNNKEGNGFLIEKLENLSINYSFNFFKDVRLTSFDIKEQLQIVVNKDNVALPLKLIAQPLSKFADEIIKTEDSKSLIALAVAKQHKQSANYGLAYLALWEAVLYRLQEMLINTFNTFIINKKITDCRKNNYYQLKAVLEQIDRNLDKNLKTLVDIRNRIAHFDSEDNNYKIREMKNILGKLHKYFSDLIKSDKMQPLANFIRDYNAT